MRAPGGTGRANGWLMALALAASPPARAQQSPMTHAADPALEVPAASDRARPDMTSGMDMDDATGFHRVWIENLEAVAGTAGGGAWDAQAWFGGDFDRLWLKSEGADLGGVVQGARAEALWAHAILPFWNSQLGVRDDFAAGPSRQWLAFGVSGITPYWFDTELTAYLGSSARTALRLKTEYDLYLTQRLVVKPEIELNAYGRPDPARDIGAGLAEGQFAVRLRYEFYRRLAPYLGFVYDRRFGGSAILARNAGEAALEHRAVAGFEAFF